MKKIAILMMGAVVALSSCSKEESYTAGSDSNVVSFSAGDIRTRVTGTSFDLNDVITVQAYQDGVAFASADYSYVGNSNEFTSATPISFQSDAAIELSYQAVYPAVESFSNSFTHTISTYQSVADNYESSDLLVATVDATTSLKPSLTFVHRMSRVNLTMIVNRDGVASTADAVNSLKINAAVEAECDITADTYAASGSVVEITPAGSALEYSVLVAPQTISAGGFAVATIGESTFSMANVEATLASGYVYELEWTIELTTGTQSVEIVGIVEEWTPGVWGDEDDTTEGGGEAPQVDESLTMTFEYETFDSQSTYATVVVDEATFDVYNVYSYSSCFATGADSYLYNRTELVGLSEIVIDYSSSSELTIYAGTEVNPSTNAITGAENADGNMVYTIPADCKFITMVNETSTYSNSNSITIKYTSLGETVESTVAVPVTIYAADWGVSNAESVETTTLQGYTFSFAGTATTSSNTAKYYSSGNGTIRYYVGDVMTIASADGSKISQIVFDTDDSAAMTTTVGTFDASAKTWTGSASSVEFTATGTNKIESFTISAE